MVYLGGPRGRGGIFRSRAIYLHDPPPGYRPPRPRIPLKDRQRQALQERALMRVSIVVLALTAVAFMVMILLVIALHS